MADLPPGWNRQTDEHGRPFYVNTNTGAWSYSPPPPPPPPPDHSATAPPLSSSDSYGGNQYAHHAGSYRPSPGVNSQPPAAYPPPSVPPQSSPMASHPHPVPGPPDYSTSAPPHSQAYPAPSQSYSPQSPGYPSHNPPYAMHSQTHASHTPSYAQPPGPAPNGGSSSYPDRYGAPQPGGHAAPPPPQGGHGPPYGGYPPSQHSYGRPSQGAYGQPSHDPHRPPPPPPGGYPPQDPHAQPHGGYGQPHGGYGAPPGHGPPPPHPGGHPPPAPGGHPPPPPPPGDYGRPQPPMQGGYGHSSPPTYPLPPPQGAPPSQPLQPPPKGYPSAPGHSGQQPVPPHQQSVPPHQQSYQPPPAQHPSQMMHAPGSITSMTTGMSQLSMGMGPHSKVVPISLEFRAHGLRDRDFIGKSDPVLHVLEPKDHILDQAQVSQWKRLGSTEAIRNNTNPTWVERVKVRYYFERHQPLRFELVDVDNFKTMQGDHLGFAETTLAEIVRNSAVRLSIRKKTGGTGRGELTVRAHSDDPAGKVRLQLSLAGKNLDKKDFMGKSDPYYKLLKVMPGSAGTSALYKSEEKMNDCNPTWKPHTVMMPAGAMPWSQISLTVQVYDWDRKKQAKKGNRYKNSGELLVHRADAIELPDFISYLQGGLRLEFIVAVDFTASNRPPDNPLSLHYMGDPSHPSQYCQALHAVGTILSGYLADGYITALGFGAKLPGLQEASFDFALSGQADARVFGVQGLLQAYETALSNVTLAGPTNFTPIIRNAMAVANSVPVSQANQHFAVLLILTDGIITDLPETIDTIIEASQATPMAIVIVGIGKADFKAMTRLDGDNSTLRSDKGDKVAKHDIVQFTKFDPTKPIEYLASDVLHEVPQRVVEFMADGGIKPNAPVGQAPTY